ncbi:MAG: DUF3306 domain-containing protein [Hyphomicrobiales bacterium]|nr:DUF3306 domain-containing protein [Hyphomicrobiales bacterium]MCP5371816.1 DUF3306 domain-containing protein [Hyphomicrobiales bacterium]
MSDDGEGRLQRWSRRKAESRRGRAAPVAEPADGIAAAAMPADPAPQPGLDAAPAGQVPAAADAGAADAGTADDAAAPPDLPPLDSLDRDSDYTPFLADGVPEALTRAALRTLWRSDPVFANLDGLNDYDQDFNTLGTAISLLDTDYRVGRGFAGPEPAEDPETTAAAAEPDTDSAPPDDSETAPPDPEAADGPADGVADGGEVAEAGDTGPAHPDGEVAAAADGAPAGPGNRA